MSQTPISTSTPPSNSPGATRPYAQPPPPLPPPPPEDPHTQGFFETLYPADYKNKMLPEKNRDGLCILQTNNFLT